MSLPRLLTIKDVAVALRCSERTVARLTKSGRIPPPLRVGGSLRWEFAVISQWLTDHRQGKAS